MTKKGTTLKCVLLDANIIIEAYKLGIWEELIERVEITVSSIVANDEVLFFSKQEDKIPTPINLRNLIEQEKINELSATQDEMTSFLNIFDSVFTQGLDPGEIESLCIIENGNAGDSFFCTSDAPAIKALAMIGHSNVGISMELILKKVGLQKRLSKQFTDGFFKALIKEGQQTLITGQGLRK